MTPKPPPLQQAEALLQATLADCRGDLPGAIAKLQSITASEGNSQTAGLALACAWLEAGEAEKAAAIVAPLSGSSEPNRQAALEILADSERMTRLGRSPAGYVRHLFDQFAADYDRSMVGTLGYRAPEILRSLAGVIIGGLDGLDILDLGCGTGLAGQAFRDVARRLDGVDLSPLSIERAKQKGIYDGLLVADLEVFLQQGGRRYDLLIAADTLVYFGDLSAVFRGAHARLKGNGFFLFTVENQGQVGFSLGPKRRYRHSAGYLRAEADRCGFGCMGMLDCTPRYNAGQPVEGLAVALRRI